ncbi:MAG: hypothetical protein L7V85_04265 [Bacteroidia bacterium]|nr:hypothetical protein [Bacteroidia bacterium]
MKKNYKQRNWLFKLKTIFTFSFILIVSLASAQLNGTYTIDSSAITSGTNYQIFTDFADTITKYGVSGPVIVNVASNSGPYYQWVEFGDISGANSTNTITLNGNTVSHPGSNSRSPVFTFKSTDHFTLDNLIIENTGTDYGRCIQIRDASTYFIISNCQLNMPNMTSNSSRNCYILLGNGSNGTIFTFANAAEHCSISNNVTNGPANGGPYWGIFAADETSNTDNKFNTIHGNEIKDFLHYGFRTYYCDEGTTITNNKIHNTGHTNNTPTFGIYVFQFGAVGGLNISNKKIYNLRRTGTEACYGIYYYTFNGHRVVSVFNLV